MHKNIARLSLVALLAGLLHVIGMAGSAQAISPTVHVDSLSSPSPGTLSIAGWGYDPDFPEFPITVDVIINGAVVGGFEADDPRSDVGAHGFSGTFNVTATGQVAVYVVANDLQAEPDTMIYAGTVTIEDNSPTGAVESVSSRVHRTVSLTGWARDADRPYASFMAIDAYIGGDRNTLGAERHSFTANLWRADGRVGFTASLTTAKTGTQNVYVYAQNLSGTRGDVRLIGIVPVSIYVDTIPPETTITSAPEAATTDDLVDVKFTSSERNSTFQCRWDQEPWFDCTGGTAAKLTVGTHRIAVRATDFYGNQDASPALRDITVTQAATQTGPSIVAKAVKKKSRLRINVGPDSATTNYRVIIQRKVGKKWRKVTRARTRGPKDIVTINLKRGKYRAVLPKSAAGPALRSNTVRLKR